LHGDDGRTLRHVLLHTGVEILELSVSVRVM
jgi:hypothetical protein